MRVDIPELKGRIAKADKNRKIVAHELGMYRDTFSRKLNTGGEDFTIKDVYGLAESLNLTKDEITEIFFSS